MLPCVCVLQKKEDAAAKQKREEEEAKAEEEAKKTAEVSTVPPKQLGRKSTAEERAVRLHSRFCLALLSLKVSWFSHGFYGILMVFM